MRARRRRPGTRSRHVSFVARETSPGRPHFASANALPIRGHRKVRRRSAPKVGTTVVLRTTAPSPSVGARVSDRGSRSRADGQRQGRLRRPQSVGLAAALPGQPQRNSAAVTHVSGARSTSPAYPDFERQPPLPTAGSSDTRRAAPLSWIGRWGPRSNSFGRPIRASQDRGRVPL
jgi:hypothetical protein